MWQFLCAFSAGVYVGTYYNCKPMINQIIIIMHDLHKKFPKEMDKKADKVEKNDKTN